MVCWEPVSPGACVSDCLIGPAGLLACLIGPAGLFKLAVCLPKNVIVGVWVGVTGWFLTLPIIGSAHPSFIPDSVWGGVRTQADQPGAYRSSTAVNNGAWPAAVVDRDKEDSRRRQCHLPAKQCARLQAARSPSSARRDVRNPGFASGSMVACWHRIMSGSGEGDEEAPPRYLTCCCKNTMTGRLQSVWGRPCPESE